MKQIFFSIVFFISITVNAQVGIGIASPNASAQLDISSGDKGLLIPRMTEAQITAISLPATGLLVFQTDNAKGFYYYNGIAWTQLHSGVLAIANGGTGSTTQNFVDLTTGQSIAGAKAFSSDLSANGVTVGRGAGDMDNNTAVGYQTLKSNTTGFFNTAFGVSALVTNTTGARNTAIGSQALYANNGYDNTSTGSLALQSNTTGSFNVGVGSAALSSNTTGGFNTAVGSMSLSTNVHGGNNTALGNSSLALNESGSGNTAAGANSLPSNVSGTYNTAVGVQSLEQTTTGNDNTVVGAAAIDRNTTGSNNAILGAFAGRYIGDGVTYNTLINASVLIGAESKPAADDESNQIVIGYAAIGNGSNTVQLGNASITDVKTSGNLTAAGYKTPAGTSSQFLKADGSVDENTYLTSEDEESNYLPITGGTLTGGLIGTTADFSGDASISGSLNVTGNIDAAGNLNTGALNSSGAITGTSIVKSGGTSSEFLMADGTVSTSITTPGVKTPTNIDIVKSIESGSNIDLLTAAASGVIVVVKNVSASNITVVTSSSSSITLNANSTAVFMRISGIEFSMLLMN